MRWNVLGSGERLLRAEQLSLVLRSVPALILRQEIASSSVGEAEDVAKLKAKQVVQARLLQWEAGEWLAVVEQLVADRLL